MFYLIYSYYFLPKILSRDSIVINLFWLLLLAHLIADFPLQMDWIYSLKKRYSWGVLPHVGIFFFFSVCLAFPFVKFSYFWIGLFSLVITHAIIDRTKTILTQKFLNDGFILFALDQGIHIFLIWLISNKVMQLENVEIEPMFLRGFFLNQHLHIYLCGLIFTVFGGTIVIHHFRLWLERVRPERNNPNVQFPSLYARLPGYIERAILFTAIVMGGYHLILAPTAFLPRLFLQRNGVKSRRFIASNLIIGILITVFTSLLINYAYRFSTW